MHYTSLDAFVNDLPALAERCRDRLRGHDALFLLETRQGRRAYISLKDGLVHVSGSSEEQPVCTVRADEELLLDLICGRVSPMKALLTRRVTIEGNPAPLMNLIRLL